jgi:GNAT superfamily N-acetyltransferase
MTLDGETRDLVLPHHVVRVRPLRPSDRTLYERAVIDLSPRSRYLRFFAPIVKPSERLLDQMTQTDGHRHVAFVALTPDESTAVGVIRYVLASDDARSGELALAVADDWQRRGMGARLLRHTVQHARMAGLEALTATRLRENRGVAGLLAAFGFAAAGASGPYAEHRLPLGR